jgi:alginate O-acetyltransferase complex protein AlgI
VVFSSIPFLFYFLPSVLLAYFLVPVAWRNALLLVSGLVFYTWGAGSFVLVLLLSIACNWVFSLLAARANDANRPGLRTLVMTGAVVFNLGLLGYFKYVNFLVAQFDSLARWVWPGFTPLPVPGILLPIGISFITFQAISYVADVAGGRERPLRNPVDYAMYIAMFPHSIAEPIVRFHLISAQIPPAARDLSWDRTFSGLVRFAHGLVKKVVLADSIALLVDPVFASAGGLSPAMAWVGVLGFTLQVYFDFSGYSDMAIGLARIFGFTFPENFHRPLASVSITDFWRRWHITLSEWFRDYVYIPLGGSRTTPFKLYRNLFTVFLLVGIWHGANWTYVVFGAWHGLCICFDRWRGKRFASDFRHPQLAWVANFTLLLLTLVLFRSKDLAQAWDYYRSLFGLTEIAATAPLWLDFSRETLIALAVGALTLFLPREFTGGRFLDESGSRWAGWTRLAVVGVAMTVALALVLSRNFLSFIYFQF